MDIEKFLLNMYNRPTFTRHRNNFELLSSFQTACEDLAVRCCTRKDFSFSLRYKRLFFLRREYRRLIDDKLISADLL